MCNWRCKKCNCRESNWGLGGYQKNQGERRQPMHHIGHFSCPPRYHKSNINTLIPKKYTSRDCWLTDPPAFSPQPSSSLLFPHPPLPPPSPCCLSASVSTLCISLLISLALFANTKISFSFFSPLLICRPTSAGEQRLPHCHNPFIVHFLTSTPRESTLRPPILSAQPSSRAPTPLPPHAAPTSTPPALTRVS